jgi:hypothetical protein
MRRSTTLALALLVGCSTHPPEAPDRPAAQPPRLVLQITVDQLRADLPLRYEDRLSEGGFLRLRRGGLWYEDAHHGHALTETIAGHATLATGEDPAVHGLISNVWFDRASGELVYNVEDAEHPIVGGEAPAESEELDPTMRLARSEGRSPRALLVPTFAERLEAATDGASKVFAVSIKDRGAISMVGRAGEAYWFSKSRGAFVTSTFYRDALPAWAAEWNAAGKVGAFAGTDWELLREQGTYVHADADDQPWEAEVAGFGRVFPHAYGSADSSAYTTLLTLSPAGDALTLDFARTLLDTERLGLDDVPDYLSISLSSTDYVGHVFGPSSLEAEDNLLRLDLALARLLDHVDGRVGLEHTLVVLSADHGTPEVPGLLVQRGERAGYANLEPLEDEQVLAALAGHGLAADAVACWFSPQLWLDHGVIEAAGADRCAVARDVAEALGVDAAVHLALATCELDDPPAGADPRLVEQVRRSAHPERAGDVYVVLERNHFANDFDGLPVAAVHGSPWEYDTHVPIVVMGPAHEAWPESSDSRFASWRRAETVEVARFLTAAVGVSEEWDGPSLAEVRHGLPGVVGAEGEGED